MIETTSDGKRLRVRVLVPGTKKKKDIGVFDTEVAATRAEKAHYAACRIEGGETVALYGDKVLRQREDATTVRDPRNDWSRFTHHVLPDAIAHVPVRELRRRDVRAFVKRLDAKKSERTAARLSHQTKQNVLNVLRVIVASAIEDELIAVDPFLKISVEPDKRTHDTWRYAMPALQRAMLAAAHAHERTIIAVAMYTGLRAGELATLRLEDVHADGDDPHFVVRYGTPPAKPTKTSTVRSVPLFGEALSAIRPWLAGELAAYCPMPVNRYALAFPLQGGGFRDPDHILPWERWRAIRDESQAQRGFRWHDLRHTCGTSLASGWWGGRRWSTEEIQKVLGHAQPATTARYAKIADEAIKAAARETRKAMASEGQVPQECPLALSDAARLVASSIKRFAALHSSRLGDLNPRPAVYETAPIAWLRILSSEKGTYGALLASVEARDEVAAGEGLAEFALGVLWRKEVQLALEVLGGGPFAVHRAVELHTVVDAGLGYPVLPAYAGAGA